MSTSHQFSIHLFPDNSDNSASTSPSPNNYLSSDELDLLDPTHRGLHRFVPRHKDEIEIDITNRKINLNIDQKTFDNRMKNIKKFEPKINKGYLGRYATVS